MSVRSDLRVLYHLALKPVRGSSHAERMEDFYNHQAADYDAFREKLLPGRRELIELLPFEDGQTWVDLGGGVESGFHPGHRRAIEACQRRGLVAVAAALR